ncbi:MAG: hypothetical protein K2P59_10210 [Acetatifactor sp.]|nr:hypothetical protein [Acetatifactor sp.]
MPSQEDYLDQLLENLMNGGIERPKEDDAESAASRDTGNISAAQTGGGGVMGTDMGLSGMQDLFGTSDMPGGSELSEMSNDLEAYEDNDVLGTPVDDSGLAELLKSFEDAGDTGISAGASVADFSDVASPGNRSDSLQSVDISNMTEDDIEKLLEGNRKMPEESVAGSEDVFQGDVVDLLEGTQDSELQEIQDLLEKSDNNEAVGEEIEDILRGAVQDEAAGGSRTEMNTDHMDGAEEQLSPKQQKAMEKKRIKEEKAAARKAKKEARKAEKAARKAAGKGKDGVQGVDGVPGGAESAGTTSDAGEPVDTAFLDSILSEAGKIDGAENISGATGNYDAKVENIIPAENEDASAAQNTASGGSSVNNDLGIDLNDLFGDSSDAESAMMAGGGTSDLPDFMVLDGDDVTGIRELTGEDEEETKPRKKGFFSRFLEFLTEEDEEEEENENIKLSEENKGIIEDLDKEKNKKDKKGKKGKKKVKKADASARDEDEEGGEEKQEKKKKAKKPKKEKPPKEEEPVEPGRKLSPRKVLPIALICLSLGAAIIVIVFAAVDFTDKKNARDAYYAGDYRTCYQNLFGKDLNENEQVMYGKSASILTIRLWISEYEMLTAEGAGLEALDSLIQSVNDYPSLYEYAIQWNAGGEVAQEYATILNLLYENYGLTEDQARAIAAEPDDIEYTRQVNMIVQGGSYGSWNEPEPETEAPLQDELPEETELPEGNFIDTNTSVQ